MGFTTKTLGELLEYIDTERLKLPEIQREFVWKRESIKLLFDSLYRGLPIGQMLVWKPTEGTPKARKFKGKPNKHEPGKVDQFYGYLLDGQQRLTAISLVRDADEEYPLTINLWSQVEPGTDTFFWGGPKSSDNPWYLRLSDVLARDFNIMRHLEQLAGDPDFRDEFKERILKMLTEIQKILEYDISIIEFESDDYRLATELFIRFNSTGKKLNRTDLALAELATRMEGFVSARMGKAADQWAPGYYFTRPFLVQCLAAVHTGHMNLKNPDRVWGPSSPKEIERSWEKTAGALDSVVEFLTGTVMWDSATWLPSFNALIPLVYIIANGGAFNATSGGLARRWLLLAGVRGYFSGAVYSELDRILRRLVEKPTVQELWNTTKKKLPKLDVDDLAVTRRTGPLMSLFVSMVRQADGRDWVSGNPLSGTVLGKKARLHVHHFFPRALLLKHDYSASWIDTFGNYTLLCASTNLDIATEEPATYLPRLKAKEKQLAVQCIPLEPEWLHVRHYEEFLEEREKMLVKTLNEYLDYA